MKINTITFHKVCNNGAALQAYALMKYLISEGNDVEIINYQPQKVQEPYKIFFQKQESTKDIWKKIIREVVSPIFRIKSRINFYKFQKKYLYITKRVYKNINDLRSYYPKSELYICGSDQIWNDDITGGVDEGYFLQFGDEKTKKVSYAASFGKKLNDDSLKKVVEYLEKFDGISIREKESLSFLKNTNLQANIVLDPVFLLEKDKWEIIGKKRVVNNKYLLIYALCPGEELYKSARRIAKEKNLKIVEISNKITKNNNADINFSFIGPEQFVALFNYSDFVITNSFHGTAFSIIMQKEFLCFPHNLIKDRNERILNLLDITGLSERFIDYGKHEKLSNNINYDRVEKILNNRINESKEYLRSFIK